MKFSHWLTIFTLIIVGLLIFSLRDIVIQIFAAIILSMCICGFTNRVKLILSIPRSFALFITIGIFAVLLCLSLIIVVPPFLEEFQQLIVQLPKAATELKDIGIDFIQVISNLFYGDNQKTILTPELLINNLNQLPDNSSVANGIADGIGKLLGWAGNLGSGIAQLIFIFVISLMIAIQPSSYRQAAIKLLPSFYRRRANNILSKCNDALDSWMIGLLISSSCVAIMAGLGLSLLGVKLVIANALLAGVLNIIPNIGPVISTIFPMSVALLDDPWKALAVLLLYIFIQSIESYIITPSIMQRQVNLLPGLTLTAQLIFTISFGPLGLFLSLPLAVISQVFISEVIVHDILDPWKGKRLLK